MPDLNELIQGFELVDEKIQNEDGAFKAYVIDLKAHGFEKGPREEI